MGKPRQLKLLGDQLVAVDENQTARVERHRPSPRANYMVLTDIHCVPRQIAEILDHSPPSSPSVPGDTRTRTFTATRLSPVSLAVPRASTTRIAANAQTHGLSRIVNPWGRGSRCGGVVVVDHKPGRRVTIFTRTT